MFTTNRYNFRILFSDVMWYFIKNGSHISILFMAKNTAWGYFLIVDILCEDLPENFVKKEIFASRRFL